MVIKEYVCAAHGDFDSASASCPHGCTGDLMVHRAFRTAPAIRTASFGGINRTLETLASDHGLTNMTNASGEGMRRADFATHQRLARATEMVVGAGKAIAGQDAGQYFQPLGNFKPGSTGDGGVLRKEAGRTMLGDMPLSAPKPRLEAAPFDGSKLGVPAGDL